MTDIIAQFENTADGVRSYVAHVPTGFSVSLQDLDSGEFLGSVVIYKDEATAILNAQKAAGV